VESAEAIFLFLRFIPLEYAPRQRHNRTLRNGALFMPELLSFSIIRVIHQTQS
jgi:hypothetical protein